ncbi:MAG: hypothetical protein PF495_03845 [Spirochaetales bacterium]|jgi:hypothetical protein|nr:hypothetical protein [Spirochaetales bacterium]
MTLITVGRCLMATLMLMGGIHHASAAVYGILNITNSPKEAEATKQGSSLYIGYSVDGGR